MSSTFRTDRNNNPTAFTTDIAKEAGLTYGIDYIQGDMFTEGNATYYTAKLLSDPVDLTIEVIDKLGFYNNKGNSRWIYIAIPYKLWMSLTKLQKTYVIGYMYNQEGGTDMKTLFPQELV
jgi:hypothetical protein